MSDTLTTISRRLRDMFQLSRMLIFGSLLATAALVVSSCGGGGDGTVGPTTKSISISPANPELAVSQTVSLVATVDGVAAQPGAVFWSSSDPNIATVSESGLVTARTVGTARVAASTQGRSAETTIRVLPPKVARVEVVPDVRSLLAGDTTNVRVTAYDANDVALTGRTVTLTSGTPTVVAVLPGLRVVALAPGSARLTATVEGVSATVDLFVKAAAVATIELIPDSTTVAIGATTKLVAIAHDLAGQALPGRSITFATSAPNIASVTDDGTVVGVAPGRAVITASSEGASTRAVIIVPPPTASQLTITPPTATLVRNETLTLTAVLRDATGKVITGRPVVWKSGDLNVAYVAAGGLVTAAGLGSVIITATSEGLTASAGITVVRDPVAAITLGPSTLSLTVGDVRQLTATATDNRGNAIADVNFTWTSSAPSMVVVSSTGEVRALTAGSATITASAGGVSAQATVTVARAPVASVTLSPTTLALRKGATAELTATARNSSGAPVPEASIAWSSSNSAVASVSRTGVVTAVSVGSATIKATSEGKSATASVTVSPPTVASVTIAPTSLALTTRETRTLVATARDARNNVLPDASITWTSSAPGVATVNATGKVTAVAPGSAAITASSEGVSASISVTVTRPAVTRIDLSPSTLALTVGSTGELVAIARDASGVEVSDAVITWTSSKSSFAIVSSTGVVTAVGEGTATITAATTTASGPVSAQTTVTVARAPANSVILSPSSLALRIGESGGLTATVVNASGAPVPDARVVWSSSDVAVATVSEVGVVKALTVGVATIKATSEGKSGTATVTVSRRPVKTLTITPASLNLVTGGSRSLVATARDETGAVLPDAVVTWTSNASDVATVSGAGGVTAIAAGTAVVTARSEGVDAAVPVTVTRPPVTSIVVTPASLSLAVGGTGQLVAVARDANNTVVTDAVLAWRSNNVSVATVSQTGLVTAVGYGTAGITVISEGVEAAVTVTVTRPPVSSIVVTPASLSLAIGGTGQLVAVARDANNTIVTDAVLAWRSSNASVAAVSQIGLVTAVGYGTADITVISEGVEAAVTVTVTRPPVSSIVVTPASLSLAVGGTGQLVAVARDANSTVVTDAVLAWRSSNASVATVSQTGLVTAVGNGTADVIVTSEGVEATVTVTVNRLPVSSIALSPASLSLSVGGTGQLVAVARDANNTVVTDAVLVWRSNDVSVATVSETGLVTAVGNGTADIIVSSEGAQATVAVVVNPLGVETVQVTPITLRIAAGLTSQLSAVARDSEGVTVPDARFDWVSSDAAVAEVSTSGLVTARSAGTAQITVTSQGKSATATITVVPPLPPPVVSVTISPTTLELEVSELGELAARAADSDGNSVPGAVFTWSSSNPAIVTVSPDGKVQALAVGEATITASAGDVAGMATVTVTEESGPPTPGSPSRMVIVSGDGQQAGAGEKLREKLVIRVLDSADVPVPGVIVIWTTADGDISPVLDVTARDGTSESKWRLKDREGAQTATAYVVGVGSVTFTATATDR